MLRDIAVLFPCTRKDICLLAFYGKKISHLNFKVSQRLIKTDTHSLVASVYVHWVSIPKRMESLLHCSCHFSLCLPLNKEFTKTQTNMKHFFLFYPEKVKGHMFIKLGKHLLLGGSLTHLLHT